MNLASVYFARKSTYVGMPLHAKERPPHYQQSARPIHLLIEQER
jgi:hypothetical protein